MTELGSTPRCELRALLSRYMVLCSIVGFIDLDDLVERDIFILGANVAEEDPLRLQTRIVQISYIAY